MSGAKFGIVGTGHMAARMLPAFHHCNGASVAAISSSSRERAQKFADQHNIAAAYDGLDALLSDSAVDAVYIANATSDHAAASIAALNAGKHVLCEKPFAVTAKEGERVLAAAARSGKLFMEGLWTLFLPAYQRVFALVSETNLGAPVQLTTDFGYPASPERLPRLFSTNGGGVLLDRAVYPISLALKALGPVKDLQADVTRNRDGVAVHVNIQTRHENGATAQLAASMTAMMSNRASIACTDGLISIPAPALGAETVRIDHFARSAPSASATSGAKDRLKTALKKNPALRGLRAVIAGGGERHAYGADQYLPQMQHFVHLIAAGKRTSDIVTHQLSLDVLKTIDRIRAGEQR